jgi:hypothetical protein
MEQTAKYFLRFTGNLIYDFLRNKPSDLTMSPSPVRQFGGGCFWGIFYLFLDKKKAKLAFLNVFVERMVGKIIRIIKYINI